MRLFVEEMRLHDVLYHGAPGPSHYLAPEGSTPSRIDAVYTDPRWVNGVRAEYMVGPDKTQDRKGHCPMMVTVDVKVGEPGDEEEEEQGSDEEGVNLPPPVRWPDERDVRLQQWVQQVHVEMWRGSHVDEAMGRAASVCGLDAFPWGGLATRRCRGHAQASRQAKHCAHRGIITLVSCDKAFQDPCHSETRE